MLNADHYRGKGAVNYEAHRRDRPEWAAEHEAVIDFVTEGPVLDAPIGTGRFVEIYREKNLRYAGVDLSPDMLAEVIKRDPEADVRVCDVRDLPFLDGAFTTAVCSRLLNWLHPPDMSVVLKELSRVAARLIVSIRTGVEGMAGNYTHSYAKFCAATDGLYVQDRRVLQEVDSGTFEMFNLRRPTVDDVYAQFGIQKDGTNAVIRIARVWTDHLGLKAVDWARVGVSSAYLTHDQLGVMLAQMAQDTIIGGQETQILTTRPPRRLYGPLTILRTPQRDVLLDGRRRANLWQYVSGSYLSLIVSTA